LLPTSNEGDEATMKYLSPKRRQSTLPTSRAPLFLDGCVATGVSRSMTTNASATTGTLGTKKGFDRQSRCLGRALLLPFLAMLLLFCPGNSEVAWGGVNTWTTNGPEGGIIQALAIDPVPRIPKSLREVTERRRFAMREPDRSSASARAETATVNQTGLRPRTRCTTIEITAMTIRRWMSPPATWKAKNPSAQQIKRMIPMVNSMMTSVLLSRATQILCRRSPGPRGPRLFQPARAAATA
jgi:hypothetical protein